jgi:hypothetical protein
MEVDQEKVRQLRTWSRAFFQSEIFYEGSLFMTLNRVREYIQLEATKPQSYEREYDLVVKIEEAEPDHLKVTDTSNMLFTIQCEKMNHSFKSGDVLRVAKVIKGSDERTLRAMEFTNFMSIDKWFKVHQKFHQKIENEFHSLTDVILGFYKCESLQDDGYFGGGQDDTYTE